MLSAIQTLRAFQLPSFRVPAIFAALALFIFGGLSASNVAAQSALDGFDPNTNGTVRAVVVQPDGKILIGGLFTSVLGTARNYIAPSEHRRHARCRL